MAIGVRVERPPDLQGVELRLVPDEVDVALRPEATGSQPERLRPLWHHVAPPPGALVSLWSRDKQLRLVRLSVRGTTPRWNARWVRWSFAARRAPDAQGGDAASAQDRVSEDEATLTLLLLPEEQRSANLEIVASLDGETSPEDYPFEVVLSEVPSDSGPPVVIATTPGLIRLRHLPARLLNYLPAIYSEWMPRRSGRFEPFEERPFFERFLRGFEDALDPLQELLGNIFRYFDPDAAPADFLPWLATWVALALDENWPMLKRRRLIGEAVELYRWRGTRRGLCRYLEIYTGFIPQINDQPFSGMRLGRDYLLGRNTQLGDVPHHTFVVTLAVPDPEAINEQIVRDIIEAQMPAHTAYRLNIVGGG